MHTRTQPGVYLVTERVIFRDATKQSHENLVTVFVQDTDMPSSLMLGVDTLTKNVGEEFTFRLDLFHLQSSDLSQCIWQFGDQTFKTVAPVTPGGLVQKKSYSQPGSYFVQALCLNTQQRRYTAAATVAVTPNTICLTAPQTLKCDMDEDGQPDLCDADIDGDGQSNRMGMISFERPDCSIDT